MTKIFAGDWFRDLPDAWREIRARPMFSLLLVLVLAAGMACMLFVTTLSHGLTKALPFAVPDQLYVLGTRWEAGDSVQEVDESDIQAMQVRVAQAQAQLPEAQRLQLAYCSGNQTMNLNFGTQVQRFDGSMISANLMEVLGIAPLRGPGFSAGDAASGGPQKLAISYLVWQQQFASDPNVIGRAVRVNGKSSEIVAVMPENFTFPNRSSLWIVSQSPLGLARKDALDTHAFARVPTGEALGLLNSEAKRLDQQVRNEDPGALGAEGVIVTESLRDFFGDDQTDDILNVMLLMTALVLLLACVNAGSLLFAMKMTRASELALRLALGASRWHLLRQVFTSNFLLVFAAVLIALPVAMFAVQFVMHDFQNSDDGGPPLWLDFSLDAKIVGLSILIAVATALISGLWPALKLASGAQLALRQGGRGQVTGLSKHLGAALVIFEMMCAAALLVATFNVGLSVRSLYALDLGVETQHRLTARVALFDSPTYPDSAARLKFFKSVVQEVERESGVISATLSTSLPGYLGNNSEVRKPSDDPSTRINVGQSVVEQGFLTTMQAQLLKGRWFTGSEAQGNPVVVVDQKFVAQFFPDGTDPIGQRIVLKPDEADSPQASIIGVTENLILEDASNDLEPVMLQPLEQEVPNFMSILVHVQPGAEKQAHMHARLAQAVRRVDPDVPIYWVRDYQRVLQAALAGERVLLYIYGGLCVVTILLAIGGLYGLVAFHVGQRMREFGVRRALGANTAQIVAQLMQSTGWQTLLGLGLGTAIGLPLAQKMMTDTANYAAPSLLLTSAAVLGLAFLALASTLVPARRATQVAPTVALRQD